MQDNKCIPYRQVAIVSFEEILLNNVFNLNDARVFCFDVEKLEIQLRENSAQFFIRSALRSAHFSELGAHVEARILVGQRAQARSAHFRHTQNGSFSMWQMQ